MLWRSSLIPAAALALSLLTGRIATPVIVCPVGVGAPRAEALAVGLATALATEWLLVPTLVRARMARCDS